MKLFDFHCDTAYRMNKENLSIHSPDLQINAQTMQCFSHLVQTFAFWSEKNTDDETAWKTFLRAHKLFFSQYLPQNVSYLLSIEDLRIIDHKIERLAQLKAMGIAVVTPFWAGKNAFGCAHNAEFDTGLTDWGKYVMEACFSQNLILDVSHASHQSTADILKLANEHNQTVVATHSNFFDCCAHSRNLATEHAEEIKRLGGIIGLNLYPPHLGGDMPTHFKKHLIYAIDHHLERQICLGTDFDGIDICVQGIQKQNHLIKLHHELEKSEIDHFMLNRLFYQNGIDFLKKHSIKPLAREN